MDSLVYTTYHMGGHSTYQDYLVSFEDVGYCWAPGQDAEVTLREIVNQDEIAWSADLAEIEVGLAPAPVPVDPSFLRAALALIFRF